MVVFTQLQNAYMIKALRREFWDKVIPKGLE